MEKMKEKNMINDQELDQVTGGDKFWNWLKKAEKKENETIPEAGVVFMDSEPSILVTNDFNTKFDPNV